MLQLMCNKLTQPCRLVNYFLNMFIGSFFLKLKLIHYGTHIYVKCVSHCSVSGHRKALSRRCDSGVHPLVRR